MGCSARSLKIEVNVTQSRLRATTALVAIRVEIPDQTSGWINVNTIHTLSTAGMTPERQIQGWIDGLTSLCGHFDVDPLEASSLEGRIDYTARRA